jgi:serine/threonine protein phosphatase PrpC
VADQPRLAIESIAGQRPYQEDSVLAETLGDGRTLVAVADGMGGHAAGEVASALALETLSGAILDGRPLGEAFRMANARVHEMASEPGKQGMGTTMVAVLVDGAEYSVANVGDSRGYLVSADGARRLTEDHSFVAEAMKRGQTEAEAMATPWRDALTRSIGTDEEVDVDVFGPFPLPTDSAFVLCSDGLYKTVDDGELQDLFKRSGSAQGAAQALVTAAFDNGSDDNISVAIAEYGEVPREVAPTTMVMEAFDPGSHPEEPAAEESVVAGVSGSGEPDALEAADVTEEGSLVGGLPVGALAAIVLVVGALVAMLFFGG